MKLKVKQIPLVMELLERAKDSEYGEAVKDYDTDLVKEYLELYVYDPKTLILVNKDVTAILVLTVVKEMFTYKQSLKDLMWYSETPGAGIRLLKESTKWVDEWHGINKAYLSTSLGDDKIDNIIERVGLKKIGSTFTFRRNK